MCFQIVTGEKAEFYTLEFGKRFTKFHAIAKTFVDGPNDTLDPGVYVRHGVLVARHARGKAAQRGARDASFVLADATRLPLADDSVDVWCSAFVVRNIPRLDVALAEARRVLRPGGRIGVLEIPRLERGREGPLLTPLIRLHFARVMPLLGRLISGHASAYSYLPLSVDHFLTPAEFTQALRRAGFEMRSVRVMALGTVALHIAELPDAEG